MTEEIKDINKRINDKVDTKIDPYSSKNYKFLMDINSSSLETYEEKRLHAIKEAVINMNAGFDDKEYVEKFTAARYTALNKINEELEKRKQKSNVIHLPGSGDLDMVSYLQNDLINKAVIIEDRIDVDANQIIHKFTGNLGLTMDFIKKVDSYLNSGSDFELNELIVWLKAQGIKVVSAERSFKSTFVKDFYILIAEYLEENHNVPSSESDKTAKMILEEVFDKPGFANDLYNIYRNYPDGEGGERYLEVARLLVHYDIFEDSLIKYFREKL